MVLLIIPPEIQSIQQFRFFFTAELYKIYTATENIFRFFEGFRRDTMIILQIGRGVGQIS